MDDNKEDIRLLWEDPGKLLSKYRPLVETIVAMRIKTRAIRGVEKQEYVHHILDGFTRRIPSIREQYNEQSLLRTYCTAIFKNLCSDRIKENQRSRKTRLLRDSDSIYYNSLSPLSDLAIREEVEVFGRMLKLLAKKKDKAKLFLKAHFRIPVIDSDILAYCPKAAEKDVEYFEREVNLHDDVDNVAVYRVLSKLATLAEGKEKSADSIRKWIRAMVIDLQHLMNAKRGTNHTEETLQILAERYFHEQDGTKMINRQKSLKQG